MFGNSKPGRKGLVDSGWGTGQLLEQGHFSVEEWIKGGLVVSGSSILRENRQLSESKWPGQKKELMDLKDICKVFIIDRKITSVTKSTIICVIKHTY